MNRAMFAGLLLIVTAGFVSAADLSGIWTGQTVDRNGDPQDVSFRLTQTGDAISGKMYGDNGSTPISEGKVTADAIRFVVVTELNGQITRTIYAGSIIHSSDKGEELEITRQREGAKDLAGKKGPPAAIRLRRIASTEGATSQ